MFDKTTFTAAQQAHRKGNRLAIAMLREIRRDRPGDDLSFIYGERSTINGELLIYRTQPQTNVAMKFLERLREMNSRAAEEGFAAVLTDALAYDTDVSHLEQLVRSGASHLDTAADSSEGTAPASA